MGQSSGVLFKEVSAYKRCPFMEVSLYTSAWVIVFHFIGLYSACACAMILCI